MVGLAKQKVSPFVDGKSAHLDTFFDRSSGRQAVSRGHDD